MKPYNPVPVKAMPKANPRDELKLLTIAFDHVIGNVPEENKANKKKIP